MKTNKSIKVEFNRHEKAVSKTDNQGTQIDVPSNKLDGILKGLITDVYRGETKDGEPYTRYNTEKAKQQINKWALEKCLEGILKGFLQARLDVYVDEDILMEIEEVVRERARKEFE